MAKLLVHRIQTFVDSEELHKVVPGDFTIVCKVELVIIISLHFDERA